MASEPKINTDQLQSDLNKVPTTSETLAEEGNELDQNVEREIQLEELKTLKEYNVTLAQNNAERKKYAGWIFFFTCIWATLIFVILFLHGFKKMFLSDKVLITLITSTTINSFGFFLLVVKYLFNADIRKPSNSKREIKTKV